MIKRGSTFRERHSESPALNALRASEKSAVLDELLKSSPGLIDAAEQFARELLRETSAEAIAAEVEWALGTLSSDELNGRAGRQRWGYVDPTEAAWEILGEAVEPYSRDIARLVDLGLSDAATETALGVVAGLYRCRRCDDGELLLSWAPDFADDHVDGVMDQLVKAGLDVPGERLAEVAPDWADSLVRLKP